MAKDAIEFDITDQLDTFNKAASSMSYIISRSLNDVAFNNARADASKDIHRNMEVRNKAFAGKNSIKVNRSSKDNLTVEIYHFKEQMGLQQFGGTELPKSKSLAIPVRKNFAQYAGVGVSKKIPKSLSINEIMKNAPRKKGEKIYKRKGVEPFILRKGVFIRTSEGLRLLYAFADKAAHDKKLLQMQKIIEKTYNVKLERNIERNYLKVLKG